MVSGCACPCRKVRGKGPLIDFFLLLWDSVLTDFDLQRSCAPLEFIQYLPSQEGDYTDYLLLVTIIANKSFFFVLHKRRLVTKGPSNAHLSIVIECLNIIITHRNKEQSKGISCYILVAVHCSMKRLFVRTNGWSESIWEIQLSHSVEMGKF